MRILLCLILVSISSELFAADAPPTAVVTNWQESAFAVTTSVRTNGCKLDLRRYNKTRPSFVGYWVQHVYVGDQYLFRLEHAVSQKQHSLIIHCNNDYEVGQMDFDLDGKYEMFLVASLKDQRLVDVLYVTENGWLRHSTPDEFRERQRIGERNRKSLESAEKELREVLQKAKEDLKKKELKK